MRFLVQIYAWAIENVPKVNKRQKYMNWYLSMLCRGSTEIKVLIECLHSIDFHLHNLCWTWETWWWICCFLEVRFIFEGLHFWSLNPCWLAFNFFMRKYWPTSLSLQHPAIQLQVAYENFRRSYNWTSLVYTYLSFLWIHVEASVCVLTGVPRPRKIILGGWSSILCQTHPSLFYRDLQKKFTSAHGSTKLRASARELDTWRTTLAHTAQVASARAPDIWLRGASKPNSL